MSLPGGPQQQVGQTCWITTLSMLTGIDVELFPDDIKPNLQTGDHAVDEWVHVEVRTEDFVPWQELLRDNGFELTMLSFNPHAEYYGVLLYNPQLNIGHVVAIDMGVVVDPAWPYDRLMFSEYSETYGNFEIGYILVQPIKEYHASLVSTSRPSRMRRLVDLLGHGWSRLRG